MVGAQVANFLLELYGTTGFHRGKGDLVSALSRFAQPLWAGPIIVQRFGVNYELDRKEPIGREVYFRTYEPNETRLIKKIVHPSWVCIDVGANIGYYSLHFAQLGAVVHAFEPSPTNLVRLRRNLSLNSSLDITVHECALSDFCGKAPFTATSADPGNSHLGAGANKIDVCVTTLDAFLQANNLRRIDLIKIDTEGCEVRFLWGARRSLSCFRPMLMLEINPRALKDFQNTVGELKQVLDELGYESKRIGWNTLSPNWSPPEDGDYFNILATPR